MHCPICEYAPGQESYITNNHDKETCNHPGGDMGGQSRNACIERQKHINDIYFRAQKAKEEEGRDYNARKAKSARNDGNSSTQAHSLTTEGDKSQAGTDADEILKRYAYFDLELQQHAHHHRRRGDGCEGESDGAGYFADGNFGNQ
jgi:hypothetical protein